jgi:hypothetical protein
MPRTWKEWLKRAEQMEERAKAQGYRTQRVYIDPHSFADWCLCEGMSTDSEGRQKKLPWMLSRRNTPVNADQLGLSLKITPYCGG